MFLLTPSVEVNGILRFCLHLAAARYSIQIHTFVFMCNHYHLVLTDSYGLLPRFMEDFNKLVARILNARLGRCENFFAPGSYDAKELIGAAPQLDAMTYAIVNPVKAGLVSTAAQWPGVLSLPEHHDGRELIAHRPDFFFRKKVRGARRITAVPESVSLRLCPPPAYSDMPREEFIALLSERVASKTAELQATHRGHFLGPKHVLHTNPCGAPRTRMLPRQPRRRLATDRDAFRRKRTIAAYSDFLGQYREAFRACRAGDLEVAFPYGTYHIKQYPPAQVGGRIHIEGPPARSNAPP